MAASAGARILGRFFGNTVSSAAGFGAGIAMGPVLGPPTRLLRNTINAAYPFEPPGAETLASGVAQAQVDEVQAKKWAAMSGIGDKAFGALVDIANTGPPLASALTLLRRGVWLPPRYKTALNRAAIEPEWYPGLLSLQDEWLTPAELAVMIQRTVVPNPGILPNQPSTAGSNVPPMPVVDIDVLKEAEGSGTNLDRLRAKARIIGLPASPDLAARMHFRKIITEGAYNQAILEGNTRGEWASFLLDGFRDILTSGQYVERQIRGFTDRPGRLKDTAKHGMSDEDSDKLYEVLGRSPSIHTLVVGLARGGKYPGSYANVPEPFRSDIQRSNIREEFAEVVYAARYNYPSGFQIRGEAQRGALTYDETHQILLEVGWAPKWATHFATSWTGGTATSADTHAGKAQTQLWTTLHRSYLAGESTSAEVSAALPRAGVAAATVPDVLATWDEERTIIRKQLSPAQVKKAYTEGVVNPETGGPWTKDEATAALVARGYSTADATTFLEL